MKRYAVTKPVLFEEGSGVRLVLDRNQAGDRAHTLRLEEHLGEEFPSIDAEVAAWPPREEGAAAVFVPFRRSKRLPHGVRFSPGDEILGEIPNVERYRGLVDMDSEESPEEDSDSPPAARPGAQDAAGSASPPPADTGGGDDGAEVDEGDEKAGDRLELIAMAVGELKPGDFHPSNGLPLLGPVSEIVGGEPVTRAELKAALKLRPPETDEG